ncbi:Lariat debranching enzyme [Pleurostoma richardsiae]|uniref:Lariat debranching enzyme n=1 Tax=Pleurostoma richardsiae TaxID=41990 RepID=A0AA38RHN6_9PEZI|nr:Lariat debranching enzyme [Pleurostoma richardsiae]
MASGTFEAQGVRVAIEGCGHGTLNAIYAAVETSCEARGWDDGVDLLIIGGDFQATRNAADLTIMSVPPKYRQLGDFHEYYSGARRAPCLTIFVAGNHEAAGYLWELYYGGWVAPNIYYMGAANVLRLGPLRIAGMSGIWKGFDYRKPHHERLPFSRDDVKSFYHVREIDARKLLQIRTQVDVGISHDWPRGVEKHGDQRRLFRMKPDFEEESRDGTLGNMAAEYVMDRLRPPYWFSAHLHCKFAAIKTYQPPGGSRGDSPLEIAASAQDAASVEATTITHEAQGANPDEIDLDMDDDDGAEDSKPVPASSEATEQSKQPKSAAPSSVSDALRAQLPASFTQPKRPKPATTPGQPVPPTITNTTVRFLALDKCLPGRKFLQVCDVLPHDSSSLASHPSSNASLPRYKLQYDPEWLAITRAFAPFLTIGDRTAHTPPDLGEEAYRALIDAERVWVDEHVVANGRLDVPENFTVTAPPHVPGMPESTSEQPNEYTNPQTAAFCELVGVQNLWAASEEERAERKRKGPPPEQHGPGGGFRGGGRGRGRGGNRGRGRGRGYGGRGRDR